MDTTNHRHSPQEFAALLDTAKARAVAARNEAIDALWAAAVAGVRDAGRSLAARARAASASLYPS
jgi:hypothetical protein